MNTHTERRDINTTCSACVCVCVCVLFAAFFSCAFVFITAVICLVNKKVKSIIPHKECWWGAHPKAQPLGGQGGPDPLPPKKKLNEPPQLFT